jgi:hypothetical protein
MSGMMLQMIKYSIGIELNGKKCEDEKIIQLDYILALTLMIIIKSVL